MMKNGIYFIVIALLVTGCQVIQDFDLCKFDDL